MKLSEGLILLTSAILGLSLGFFGSPLQGITDSSLNTPGKSLWVTVFRNGQLKDGLAIEIPSAICQKRDPSSALPAWISQHMGSPNCTECTLYEESGGKIESCKQLKPLQDVWFVPSGRWFMFPPGPLGRTVTLNRMKSPFGEHRPIALETISDSPKVFHIHNFLTTSEADALIDHALNDKDEITGLRRSTTGSEDQVSFNRVRTSENAFDSVSTTARTLKMRAMEVLGIAPYDEHMTDGLQVLRYNQSKAYISHHDYLDDSGGGHDFDSAKNGSNRFATILFYLSDVEKGGETVFPQGKAVDDGVSDVMDGVRPKQTSSEEEMRQTLLSDPLVSSSFTEGSWEFKMIGHCRTALAVKPKKAHAVLFYSQHPEGGLDTTSLHGGCPVIEGTKWAANLWIWNKVRLGYPRAPRKPGAKGFDATSGIGRDRLVKGQQQQQQPEAIEASFFNENVDGATLNYEDTHWDTFPPGKTIRVNTFKGHGWNVKVGQNLVKRWVIPEQPTKQRYVLKTSDIV